jgi:ATP-dependent DNA helicase RecQ
VPNIHQILKQYWGYTAFRQPQQQIIESVLAGKDTLALLPTGGGKSICFQVPAMAMDGICLVVSPLIALMKDQVMHLNKKGIKAAAIYTGMAHRQIDTLLDNCVYGNYKFLYISPERLATEDFRTRMQRMKICLLAVDEAHCISQWGFDFRPPYAKIAEVRDQLKGVPVIALTATATPKVVEDIQTQLHFKEANVFSKSFVRSNLSYVVRQSTNKEQSVADILSKVKGSAIVYVRNRKKTKEFADTLNKLRITSDFYHAGLEPKLRERKQDNWVHNKTRVIVCTNAFGMGIDKPDVRTVVHIDVPDTLEAYFQEAGRAGRDERKAYAVQLLDISDIESLNKKIKESLPSPEFIREVYNELGVYLRISYYSGMNQSFDIDLGDFATKNKWLTSKVLSALKTLQQQEIIYLTDGVFRQSQIRVAAAKDVLYKFQVENKRFDPIVKFILRSSEGVFEDYVFIDEQNMAGRLKITTHDAIQYLTKLDELGIFSYLPRKDKPQVIFLQNRLRKDELRLDVKAINARKEEYETRLKAVRNYITENDTCRTKMLVQYFGEEDSKDCGICDVCLAKKKSGLTDEQFTKAVGEIEAMLKAEPQGIDTLSMKMDLDNDNFNKVIDFLLDAGKLSRNEKKELVWVG